MKTFMKTLINLLLLLAAVGGVCYWLFGKFTRPAGKLIEKIQHKKDENA